MGIVLARVARWVSFASLFAVLAPTVVLLPFLFDSPNTPPLLVLGIIFTFPLSFILSEKGYRASLEQRAFGKAAMIGSAPPMWIGVFAGIIQMFGMLKPKQYVHTDATIIGSGNSELFIKTPENCELEVFRTKFEIRGTWKPDAKAFRFVCDGTFNSPDFLSIKEAMPISGVESRANGHSELFESDGDFETYRVSKNERVVAEITRFSGYDGQNVSVMHWTSSKNPTHRVVSRRLDDTFELTYGIDQLMANRAVMMETDRRITEYVKSIVGRKKR